MESELLLKEGEFYRENEELEKKTKELMQKVNDVMKIQDNLIRDSLITKTEILKAKKNNYGFDKNLMDICKNDDTSCAVEEMGTKSSQQFYRAKIKQLEIEIVKVQSENRKKSNELLKVQKENQKISEEKEKWFSSYNSTKAAIGKLEAQVSFLNSKLQTKDGEIAVLKKELESLKKEWKTENLNSNNLEVRLNRTYEENEKLKTALKTAKDEEKDIKESYRKQINDLTATVRQIEKHKLELLNGFKKQMQLIDNLKKQKMCLETMKVSQVSEDEYLKILEQKQN